MGPRQFLSVTAFVAVLVSLPATSSPGREAPPPTGRLYVVQAVPGATYDVSLDGHDTRSGVEVGAVLGPFVVDAGSHRVTFAPEDGGPLTAEVTVRAGGSSDLVLHLPAAVGGDPVADVYRVSTKPLAPDMARVLVAHTATVPPADVRVDGTTVFEDIANGEFAVADVPAGKHSASVVPAGTTEKPILGPLDVDLPAGTATMVYAVGSPSNGSMNVIAHQVPVSTAAEAQPSRIRTGSAGLARHVVRPFGPA